MCDGSKELADSRRDLDLGHQDQPAALGRQQAPVTVVLCTTPSGAPGVAPGGILSFAVLN